MTTINLYGVKDYIEDEKYVDSVETAKKTFKEAFALYTDDGFESFDGWKRESQTAQHSVYSRQMSYGKLFALKSAIAKPLETVFAERWHGLDSVANWNNNIEFSSTVKKLSSHIDIAHYANRDVLMVKSRAVRIWRKIDGDYYLIVRSTDVDDVPPSDRVRAIIHMGAGRFRQDPNDPDQTRRVTKCYPGTTNVGTFFVLYVIFPFGVLPYGTKGRLEELTTPIELISLENAIQGKIGKNVTMRPNRRVVCVDGAGTSILMYYEGSGFSNERIVRLQYSRSLDITYFGAIAPSVHCV